MLLKCCTTGGEKESVQSDLLSPECSVSFLRHRRTFCINFRADFFSECACKSKETLLKALKWFHTFMFAFLTAAGWFRCLVCLHTLKIKLDCVVPVTLVITSDTLCRLDYGAFRNGYAVSHRERESILKKERNLGKITALLLPCTYSKLILEYVKCNLSQLVPILN